MEIVLNLGGGLPFDGSPAQCFIQRFDEMSEENPIAPGMRVFMGCKVRLSATAKNQGIHLGDIAAISPQNGAGTAAMTAICKLADDCGVTLSGIAKGYDERETPTSVLVKWYQRFGFSIGMGNDEDGYRMARNPSAVIQLRGFKRPH